MSVIIRLQGLPWSANALDIRRFFHGLSIPEGGVHIVGGESGDAFIAFSTDEDARQAMQLDNGKIKDSRLKLLLSSRVEMQKVIETARSRNMAIQAGIITTNSPNVVVANPGVIGNVTPSVLPGPLNVISSPFDIQTVQQTPQQQQPPPQQQQQQSQLVYVNRMALEQQQQQQQQQQPNINAQKQSVQVIDYAGNAPAPPTASPASFGGLKNEQSREKDLGRSGGGRDYERDRDRSRERDKERSKGRGRRRERSRSPRRSRDRGADDGFRRRSDSREDDKDRRGNAERFRDLDVRHEMPSNNPESNNGNLERFNEPTSNRRGPSRWNRENSPVQSSQKRDMEPRGGGGGGPGNLALGPQSPDGPNVWEKSGGNMRSGMTGEQNFGGFGGPPQQQQQQQQRNSSPPRGTLVLVRGVPFNAMPVHIRDFFTGLTVNPDGIHFAVDGRGERLPIAFVRFVSERDRDLALRRPKHYLNNSVVEVLPTSEDELRAALGPMSPPPNRPSDNNNKSGGGGNVNNMNTRNCVVLQGVPPMIREGDVVRFLAGFNLKDVLLKYDNMGKPCGLCFVELSDPREAERCMEMNGQMMGPRHIEISLITKEEMEAQKADNVDRASGGGGNGPFGGGMPRNSQGFSDREPDSRETDCCVVQGLPFNADNRDIFDFFSPSGCTPVAIHLMKDSNDRASGDAVCEFGNSRQCSMALQRDGAPIRPGARIQLAVRPISRRQLEESIMMTSGGNANNNNNNYDNNFNRGGPNPNQQCRSNDPKLGLLGPMPDGRFSGPFQGSNFNNGPRFNGPGMPPQGMMMEHDNRPMMDNNGPPSRSGGGRRMSSPPLSPQQMQQQQQFNRPQGGPGKFGRQGIVVEVTNIPYRASTEDIVDFFQGFPLSEDDVIRKYNNRGQPTGDARVQFKTHDEAMAAVRKLENRNLMGRNINLTILS